MSAPSKEQFYQDLNADTWCGYDWCRRLYGYQYYDNDFLERVYAKLDALNRGRVKYIYCLFVKTQIAYEMRQTQDAGKWLVEQIDKNYERQVKETEWQKKQGKQIRVQNYATISQMLGFN